jgi:hypothetical protein
MENTLLKKIIQYRSQWKIKKIDPFPDSNKTMINITKELSYEDRRHGKPECTICTQEISRY